MDETTKHRLKSIINRLEAIPKEEWCCFHLEDIKGRHCVLGHLGVEQYDSFTEDALLIEQALRTDPIVAKKYDWALTPACALVNDDDSTGEPIHKRVVNCLLKLLRS